MSLSDLWHYLQIYVNTQTELQNEGPSSRVVQNYRSMYLIKDLWLKQAGHRKSCTFQSWSVGWKCVPKTWQLANSFQRVPRKSHFNPKVLIQDVANSKLLWFTWPNNYDFRNTILRNPKKCFVNHGKNHVNHIFKHISSPTLALKSSTDLIFWCYTEIDCASLFQRYYHNFDASALISLPAPSVEPL